MAPNQQDKLPMKPKEGESRTIREYKDGQQIRVLNYLPKRGYYDFRRSEL